MIRKSPIEPVDAAFVALLRRYQDARYPVQRSAALQLAVAQRDLATARASSPEAIAHEPDVTDPVAAYATWLDLMITGEARIRTVMLQSAEEGRRAIAGPSPSGRSFDAYCAVVARASIRRAITAIEAMTGSDEQAAVAAREDILRTWHSDDLAAEIAFVLDHAARGGR